MSTSELEISVSTPLPSPSDNALLRPIPASERAEWLDALRGFALLGILLINLTAFSGYAFIDPASKAALSWNGADGVLEYLIHALVEAKFYSLFSFLFGLGFALQLQRAEQRDGDFRSVFRRRMAWLLVFGLVHAVFVWFGDILNFYALMGFALLWFRKVSTRVLLGAAIFCLTAPVWLYAGYLLVVQLSQAAPTAAPEGGTRFAAIIDAYAHGGYGNVVQSNAMIYVFAWVRRIYRFQLLRIFGMFLLGAWAGRVGLPLAREALRPMLRRWLLVGVTIGLPMNLAFAALGGNDVLLPASAKGLLSITMGSLGIPLLSLAYFAAFALYWRKLRGSGNLLVASGRMALTHYLSQSVVCVTLFYGIGFGLFRQVSYGVGMLVVLAVFLALALLCRTWLKFNAQGPMEMLWRRLAYGRQRPADALATK
jgi:uncharacterized protein